MLKVALLTIGLGSGIYIGIKMRDAGLTNNLFNNGYGNKPINPLSVNDLEEYYKKGVIDSPDKIEKLRILRSGESQETQSLIQKEVAEPNTDSNASNRV